MIQRIFFILILFFVAFSCKKENAKSFELINPSEINPEKNTFVPKYGKPYFEYDEIDIYHTNISEDDAMKLYDTKNNSKIDKLKFDIILGEEPEKLANINFQKSLQKIGFKESKIDKNDFKKIDKIFIEKTAYDIYAASCIAVFRDLLIFKKQKKIIGFAKICFDCRQQRIIGTKVNTENFGQDGDYEKLYKILRK